MSVHYVTNQRAVVVYFDQQTGAPRTVCWSKIICFSVKMVDPLFTCFACYFVHVPFFQFSSKGFFIVNYHIKKTYNGQTYVRTLFTCFLVIFARSFLFISFFSVCNGKRCKNLFQRWKKLFWPENGMQSTHLLVKIHNQLFRPIYTDSFIGTMMFTSEQLWAGLSCQVLG